MAKTTASSERAEHARSLRGQEQFKQYLQFYEFERDPFSDAGISGLFFSGAGRRETVQSLLHYLRYGSSPVFLTGHSGSGKTTTLNALVGELESDVDVAVVPSVLMMTPGQFLSAALQGFGIQQADNSNMDLPLLLQSIAEFVAANAENDRQSLICVDNVQDLSGEVIGAMFELLDAAPALRLLAVGEPAAKALLDRAAEEFQLLINQLELPAFDQQDVRAYVRYRLDAVAYDGDFPLSDMQVQALTYRSQGSLNQLHHVARSMLIAGAQGGKQKLSPFPLTHLLALILLTIIIVVGWRHEEQVVQEPEQPIQLEGVAPIQQAPADEDAELTASGKTIAEVRQALDRLSDEVEDKADNSQPDTDAASENSTLKDMPASVVIASTASVADEAGSESGSAPAPEALEQAGDVDSASDTNISSSEVSIQPLAPEPPRDEKVNTAASEPDDQDLAEAITPLDQDLKVNPAHKRLLGWSEVGYALQIFGTHNARRAKQLVDEYFGDADLLFYETRHNGKPWYVVVNGPYSGRDAAKLSIESLPESLQRLRPWPRNIASIQADIRRFSAAIAADGESE